MKNISDSIEKFNKKCEEDRPGMIRGLVTPSDGTFVKSNTDDEYFQKWAKAVIKVRQMRDSGISLEPYQDKNGAIDLEQFFDD